MEKLTAFAARLSYGLVVACTVIMTALFIRHEFFSPRRQLASSPSAALKPAANWSEIASVGHRLGADSATVTVVEFADFECPACRYYNTRVLPSLLARFPSDVALVYRHWPLAMHRFAYPAARASECAGAQGRFAQFHDLLFAHQDSLGLKPFDKFASESGVRDLDAFRECNARATPVAAIDADRAAALKSGGLGTPTLVVNGLLYPSPPDSATLDSIVRIAIKAKERSVAATGQR